MALYNDINRVNNLRLYLRHNYYGNSNQLQNMFAYDKNYISDAQLGSDYSVALKLKHHNNYQYNSISLYDYIDGVLLALFNADSIDRLIFSDSTLTQAQKADYINLHSTFASQLGLLRYMYSVVVPTQNMAVVYL